VKVALNVADRRLKDREGTVACTPLGVARWTLKSPRPDDRNVIKASNAQMLRQAVQAVAANSLSGDHQETVVFAAPVGVDADTAAVKLRVLLSKRTKALKDEGKLVIKMQSETVVAPGANKGVKDSDKLILLCMPSGRESATCPN